MGPSTTAFFDELEKIGGMFEKALIHAVEHPVPILSRINSADKRSKRPDYRNALEEGYPASWVIHNMRPRQE